MSTLALFASAAACFDGVWVPSYSQWGTNVAVVVQGGIEAAACVVATQMGGSSTGGTGALGLAATAQVASAPTSLAHVATDVACTSSTGSSKPDSSSTHSSRHGSSTQQQTWQ